MTSSPLRTVVVRPAAGQKTTNSPETEHSLPRRSACDQRRPRQPDFDGRGWHAAGGCACEIGKASSAGRHHIQAIGLDARGTGGVGNARNA